MPKKLTTKQFIQNVIKVHGDKYDYSLVEYKNAHTKVKIICLIHGVFEQTPNNHLNKRGCKQCGIIQNNLSRKITTQDFIQKVKQVHGDKYDYSLVEYKNAHTKVKIICLIHGVFEQTPNSHLNGQGCPKCSNDNKRKTTQQFIQDTIKVHGNKYDYSLVKYKNNHTKVKIICSVHGVFEQKPSNHLNGKGCSKCKGIYKEQYYSNNIPLYDTYLLQLEPYGIKCRRNIDDQNVLEVQCMYCGKWYQPTILSVRNKINCINGKQRGERNLYCSVECKQACPTYNQTKYPKGFKVDTSREVQPHLRKLVLKRDDYQCVKCGNTDKQLHCHHITGVEINPIESADMDNCITLCIDCHHELHKLSYCNMRRGKC